MARSEDYRLAISAQYLPDSRELMVVLDDASKHLWPVDRLEMLDRELNPVLRPSNEELADVKVWGGGGSVYWETLEQVFAIDELLSGIYGRPAWMASLTVEAH